MESTRIIKNKSESHVCSDCCELATHSVTDAQELPSNQWAETNPRYGCDNHKKTSMVILLNGEKIPFSEYAS